MSSLISKSMSSVAADARMALAQKPSGIATIVLLIMMFLLVTAPLELSQLALVLIGAICYALLQTVHEKPKPDAIAGKFGGARKYSEHSSSDKFSQHAAPRRPAGSRDRERLPACDSVPQRLPQTHPLPRKGFQDRDSRARQDAPVAQPCSGQESRKPSARPILAPSFKGEGWEAQVDEFLAQLAPTPEGEEMVQQLANAVRQVILQVIPEVEVTGFAGGDLGRGTAFGVAVPEVDIVVSVSPQVLASRLQNRFIPNSQAKLDVRKLQKSAIRMCTDRLVSTGGFKFRRSAFRCQEPKVTLLAPKLGNCETAVPFDFSVNTATPLYNAALLTECGQMEPRARALILFVKRWAKDRGVCHAAKGHLSPYSWNLLTIFFLQVAGVEEGPLLPPLEGFAVSSGLMAPPAKAADSAAAQVPSKQTTLAPAPRAAGVDTGTDSLGDLFKGLVRFYNRDFQWCKEAVQVRLGQRGKPGLALPLHIIVDDEHDTTTVGPSIEDPFEPSHNLGACTTAVSLARLHEELARADELCSRGAPLVELLEPWVPPDRAVGAPEAGFEDGD